jgi:hypothetical protein
MSAKCVKRQVIGSKIALSELVTAVDRRSVRGLQMVIFVRSATMLAIGFSIAPTKAPRRKAGQIKVMWAGTAEAQKQKLTLG